MEILIKNLEDGKNYKIKIGTEVKVGDKIPYLKWVEGLKWIEALDCEVIKVFKEHKKGVID